VNGMTKDLRKLCEGRRNARLECIRHPRSTTQQEYRNLNKEVKKSSVIKLISIALENAKLNREVNKRIAIRLQIRQRNRRRNYIK